MCRGADDLKGQGMEPYVLGLIGGLLVCICCGARNTHRMTKHFELMEADYQTTLDNVHAIQHV